MKKQGSFEDITAIIIGGGLSLLAFLALSLTISTDKNNRDEQRTQALREHKTMLETRSVLQKNIQPGYKLQTFLVDAASNDNGQRGINKLKETLNQTGHDWYWSYNNREGTIPKGLNKPDLQAKPFTLPTREGKVSVLLYRYE